MVSGPTNIGPNPGQIPQIQNQLFPVQPPPQNTQQTPRPPAQSSNIPPSPNNTGLNQTNGTDTVEISQQAVGATNEGDNQFGPPQTQQNFGQTAGPPTQQGFGQTGNNPQQPVNSPGPNPNPNPGQDFNSAPGQVGPPPTPNLAPQFPQNSPVQGLAPGQSLNVLG